MLANAPNPFAVTGYGLSYGTSHIAKDVVAGPGPTGGYDRLPATAGSYSAAPEEYDAAQGTDHQSETFILGHRPVKANDLHALVPQLNRDDYDLPG